MLSEKLYKLRTENNMTQESLAEKLEVSRQSVQKWESGIACPTIDNIICLADIFHVSMDYLCRDKRLEKDNGGRIGAELLPNYERMGEWECYSKTLMLEYRQCYDEGKDIFPYKELLKEVNNMPNNGYKEQIADTLFSFIGKLPVRDGYAYIEPDELAELRRERRAYPLSFAECTGKKLENKILGGWYGRICGCLLGKPVEGIRRQELDILLKKTGNFPLKRYIDAEDLPENIDKTVAFAIKERAYSKNLGYMPTDDDTNYMLIALEVLKRYGRNFTSQNIGEVWLSTQTKYEYCTAERIAYKNLSNGFDPPVSGRYKNVFREWIGAQIRGDVFGYINPGNPELAAEMAHRDARVSHVKNGIYGEMWVSAMIAAAFGTDCIRDIVLRGLAEIPVKSRLYESVYKIVEKYDGRVSAEKCFEDICSRWDETSGYDWTHTISNAEIVTAALLYGGGDYGKSICLAVAQGFDTDCNGATVGSVLGVMKGFDSLPRVWTERICDTLISGLSDYRRVSVNAMAKETMRFVEKR